LRVVLPVNVEAAAWLPASSRPIIRMVAAMPSVYRRGNRHGAGFDPNL